MSEDDFVRMFPDVRYHRVGDQHENMIVNTIAFHIVHAHVFQHMTGLGSNGLQKTVFCKIF